MPVIAAVPVAFTLCLVCSVGEVPFRNWWMVQQGDCDALLTNPPDVSRGALQWDDSLLEKEILIYWNKPGIKDWYHGRVTAYYDPATTKHTIEWLEDDDPDSTVDLLSCKMCSEWCFVQDDEDISEALTRLRALSSS